jgi:hypothetical protein
MRCFCIISFQHYFRLCHQENLRKQRGTGIGRDTSVSGHADVHLLHENINMVKNIQAVLVLEIKLV